MRGCVYEQTGVFGPFISSTQTKEVHILHHGLIYWSHQLLGTHASVNKPPTVVARKYRARARDECGLRTSFGNNEAHFFNLESHCTFGSEFAWKFCSVVERRIFIASWREKNEVGGGGRGGPTVNWVFCRPISTHVLRRSHVTAAIISQSRFAEPCQHVTGNRVGLPCRM